MSKPFVFCLLTISLLLLSCSDWPEAQNKNVPGPTPPPTATPSADVKITSPHDGGKVNQTEMVKGTSSNVPSGNVIWVIVFVHKVGRYYPQNQPADIQSNGDWASVSYFGVATDTGLKFDAIAVLADDKGQKAIQDYLSNARDKNDYAGLERLPDGVKIYNRVSVTRQ
jgi:hypothetical protein